ncbi:biopolymer transporter ExbD [Acinetobacter sp. A3.8]|jgi:biopolymer transport protein ExbD|uniref:Biopolymer transporter ExbD n=1 Tax=Acinetobacter sedimenti TaxID=2919922 RepID=A0A9X1WXT2_9GAMM|nr:biopolymer transporter ExbD [Acinetobacter sedimenti]MCJ8146583.1 biopolymer transporter ExbD [Acinetobacter sedimenti]MEC8887401.1 biopolymer transporter ExbD [Pseudomonadota bacterium]
MKFNRPRVNEIEVNLTPMIDCLLFLLVFLLVSTTFNQHSRLNLTLPDAQGVPPTSIDERVEVVVQASGKYTVNGQALAGNDETQLTTAIQQATADRRDMPVIIAADAKAAHQDVVRVMDVAGKLGFMNINISTKVPARGY